MSDIAISVKNVSKTFKIPHEKISSLRGAVTSVFKSGGYEEFKALDDVSFEVKKGEFFGIIGRNGSGKSTLLKILAGIYQPDADAHPKVQPSEHRRLSLRKAEKKIEINGRISPFLELGIGFNPELSGRDNVYLNATVLGMSKKEIDKKFDSIVAFSELERFIDQKLKNYSSGMQVRLAFSVSIYANREILLMDEVLAVGDANFQQKCLDQFKRLKEQGKTIILVSHSQAPIEEYCDRVIMLRKGKIIMEGLPSEVFAFYNASLSNVGGTIFDKRNKANLLDIGLDIEKDKNEIFYENEKRWGNFALKIEDIIFEKMDRLFFSQDFVAGVIKIRIKNRKKLELVAEADLSLAMYGAKDALIFLDTMIVKNTEKDFIEVPFSFKIDDLSEGSYRFTIRLAHKDSDKNGIIYDHWDKDNQIYIKNSNSKYPGLINIKSVFKNNVKFLGMIRMRNESLILQDTLDNFSKIVDGIIIYDDASTDDSVDIARKHPLVLNVIENKIWKKNRISEETENRKTLLEYAQHYNPEWLFYADCDERFEEGIREFILSQESDGVDGVRIMLFDAYMTNENKKPYTSGSLWNFRDKFGPERRDILMIWRNSVKVRYEGLDSREPKGVENIITRFHCQHYGKALSEKHWEETCAYYMNNFPEPYATKWKARRGLAIHNKSDFNRRLYSWDDVQKNNF